MTTMTVENPVDAALTTLEDSITAETRRLNRAIETEDDKLTREQAAFNAEWGVTWNQKQHNNKADYEAAYAALVARKRPILEKRGQLRAQLEQLPYAREAGLKRISLTTQVGPDIRVRPVDLPVAARDDGEIRRLDAERVTLSQERQQLALDRPLVESALREATLRAETIAARARVGVADAGDLKSADRAVKDAGAVLTKVDDRIAAIDRRLSNIETAIAERETKLAAERRDCIAREIARTLFAAADALLPAMAEMTLLRRLLGAAEQVGSVWTISGLDADDPRSVGRELLQMALEHGWQPKRQSAT